MHYKRSPLSRIFKLSTIALIISYSLSSAFSQEQQPKSEEELVERIEITSTKRAVFANEVAKSVSLISEADLDVLGAVSIVDAGFSIPNTVIDQPGGATGTNVRIRGIGDVGVYIDDVLLGQNTSYSAGLLDVVQVEVLRGPQGTLFGRNTTGGVINTITRKPTDDPFAMVDFTVGNYDLKQLRLTAGAKLVGDLSGKISLISSDREGYSTDVTNGKDFNGQTYSGGRAQLYWDVSSKLELQFSFDYFVNDTTGRADELVAVTEFTPPEVVASVEGNLNPFDHRIDISDIDNFDKSENWGTYIRADYTTDNDFLFTSISAYREGELDSLTDPDFTNFDYAVTFGEGENWQISQEFRLVSPEYDALNWVIGLYYFKDDSDSSVNNLLTGLGASAFGLPPLEISSPDTTSTKREDFAVFGNLNYNINDDLILELGLRYSDESTETTAFSTRFGPAIDAVGGLVESQIRAGIEAQVRSMVPQGTPEDIILATIQQTIDQQLPLLFGPTLEGFLGPQLGPLTNIDPITFTPTDFNGTINNESLTSSMSLTYSLNDNNNVYMAISNAEKQGGFNTGFGNEGLADDLVTFESEVVTNYEIGIKGSIGDFAYSSSAFLMKYDDIQLVRRVDNPNSAAGVSFIVDNAGEAEIQGLELTIRGDLSDSIALFADVGYLTTELTKVNDGVDESLVGNELAFSPEVTGNIGLTATFPLDDNGTIRFTPQIQYRDKSFLSNQNLFVVPDTVLVNANITWISQNETWQVTARALNITDDIYYTNANLGTFFTNMVAASISAPSRYTLEVKYTF